MKQATGVIVHTIGSGIYPYAISFAGADGYSLTISNGDDELREEDYGKTAIVEYEDGNPFCRFKCFYSKETAHA
jgi:hypothetical protein